MTEDTPEKETLAEENIKDIILVHEQLGYDLERKIEDVKELHEQRPEVKAFRELEDKARHRAAQMMSDSMTKTTGLHDSNFPEKTQEQIEEWLLKGWEWWDGEDDGDYVDKVEVGPTYVEVGYMYRRHCTCGCGDTNDDFRRFKFPISWLSDEVYNEVKRVRDEKLAEKARRDQIVKDKEEKEQYLKSKAKFEGEA